MIRKMTLIISLYVVQMTSATVTSPIYTIPNFFSPAKRNAETTRVATTRPTKSSQIRSWIALAMSSRIAKTFKASSSTTAWAEARVRVWAR